MCIIYPHTCNYQNCTFAHTENYRLFVSLRRSETYIPRRPEIQSGYIISGGLQGCNNGSEMSFRQGRNHRTRQGQSCCFPHTDTELHCLDRRELLSGMDSMQAEKTVYGSSNFLLQQQQQQQPHVLQPTPSPHVNIALIPITTFIHRLSLLRLLFCCMDLTSHAFQHSEFLEGYTCMSEVNNYHRNSFKGRVDQHEFHKVKYNERVSTSEWDLG